MIIEYSDELRRAMQVNSHEQKLADAITWLGKKWVCHPVNRVAKLPEPLPPPYQWKPTVLRGRK